MVPNDRRQRREQLAWRSCCSGCEPLDEPEVELRAVAPDQVHLAREPGEGRQVSQRATGDHGDDRLRKRGERPDGCHGLGQRPGGGWVVDEWSERSVVVAPDQQLRDARYVGEGGAQFRVKASVCHDLLRSLRRWSSLWITLITCHKQDAHPSGSPTSGVSRASCSGANAYGAGEVRRQAASPREPVRVQRCDDGRSRRALEEEQVMAVPEMHHVHCAVQRVQHSAFRVVGHRGAGGQRGRLDARSACGSGPNRGAGRRDRPARAQWPSPRRRIRDRPCEPSRPRSRTTSPVSRSAATTAPPGPRPAVTPTIRARARRA